MMGNGVLNDFFYRLPAPAFPDLPFLLLADKPAHLGREGNRDAIMKLYYFVVHGFSFLQRRCPWR
jgi:hypothetical protein